LLREAQIAVPRGAAVRSADEAIAKLRVLTKIRARRCKSAQECLRLAALWRCTNRVIRLDRKPSTGQLVMDVKSWGSNG